MNKLSRMVVVSFAVLLLAVWIMPMTGSAQLKMPKKKAGGGGEAGGGGGELKPYPPCNGPKKRIAIYRFKDGANNDMSAAIRDSMLEAFQYELQQTGCFVLLVTNEDLEDSAAEIRHGQSGMGNQGRSPQAGQQLGAQAIFQGTIQEVAFTQSQGIGVGNIPIGGIATGGVGVKVSQAKVVVIIKMFDPETRVLEFSERAEGAINKTAVAVESNIKGVVVGGKLQKQTPIGDAALRAIHNAVYIVLTKMNSMPWQATILKVEGKKVIIRAGTDSGIQVGQTLNVYKPGDKVEDPDTGEMVSLPATKLGQVRVTEVLEKFIYAEIVSGPAVVGNWVRLEQ